MIVLDVAYEWVTVKCRTLVGSRLEKLQSLRANAGTEVLAMKWPTRTRVDDFRCNAVDFPIDVGASQQMKSGWDVAQLHVLS